MADTAVAAKHAVLVEDRMTRHAHPAHQAVCAHALELEIPEALMGLELRAMCGPLPGIQAVRMCFPSREAEEAEGAPARVAQAVGQVVLRAPHEAEVLILLPAPVCRELGQRA